MDTNTASPARRSSHGLWTRWPATTISALTGLTALALVLASEPTAVVPLEVDSDADVEMAVDEEAGPSGTVHKGEEGKMGKPTSKSKSGLYAMKGPADAIPMMARSFDPEMAVRSAGILGKMEPGAFAVGSDDADVWGGLTGTEIGEAYGVGGLGLVGTGRGGGGTGEGTIGLGSDKGSRASVRAEAADGRYDGSLQARVLTAGVVDDNADAKAYEDVLTRLSSVRAPLGLEDSVWHMDPPKQRHIATPGGLDIALVIDTTGSMGDELEYLKVEIRDIARQVAQDFPGVSQRWGLVVYRDQGDEYVTRHADFQSIEKFVDALGRQEANGGGDTPEAMHAAMAASSELSWRTGDDTARMVFLVADAPTHEGAEARKFATSVLAHRKAHTAVFPVAGSGVSDQAEAELRLAAKVTGGQYIFLTDHSGVGGHHAAPHVDQYKVESLHDAMARMIRKELGDPRAARVATDPAPVVDIPLCDDVPSPAISVALDAPPQLAFGTPGMWDELKERLAAHLLFASTISLLVFAAMGLDTFMRLRRRRVRG